MDALKELEKANILLGELCAQVRQRDAKIAELKRRLTTALSRLADTENQLSRYKRTYHKAN
jgi:chromosome segregation ATPase